MKINSYQLCQLELLTFESLKQFINKGVNLLFFTFMGLETIRYISKFVMTECVIAIKFPKDL